MKVTEHYFPVLLFIMLEKVSPVVDKILICDNSMSSIPFGCAAIFSSFNILQSKVRNFLFKV